MSSYFDEKQELAIALKKQAEAVESSSETDEYSKFMRLSEIENGLRSLDEAVVFDCSCCVEYPGCPDDIRESVAKCIYSLSVNCQPINRSSKFCPSPDLASEHAEMVGNMIYNLHDVFHDLANRGIDGFSDHPLTPIRRLAVQGETRREAMVPRSELSELGLKIVDGTYGTIP